MAAGLASCGGTADDHSPQAQAIAQVIRGAETAELNLTDPPAVFSGGPPTHEVLTAMVDPRPPRARPYYTGPLSEGKVSSTGGETGWLHFLRGRPASAEIEAAPGSTAEAVGPMHERRSDQLAVIVVSCSVSYLLRSSATASGFGGPGLASRSASSSK